MNIAYLESQLTEFKQKRLTSIELPINDNYKLLDEFLNVMVKLDQEKKAKAKLKEIAQPQEITKDFIDQNFSSLQRYFIYPLFGFSDCTSNELIAARIMATQELNRLERVKKSEQDQDLKRCCDKAIYILRKGLNK
jgi:hypothetical protein